MNNKFLAIIPARGGSKSIPRKNIKLLGGKPLIAYTIEEALKSKFLDRVIVSTDDKKIADVARRYKAEVPFLRPSKLAQDYSLDKPVFVHAVNWLEKNDGYKIDILVNLRPTSPFRTVRHIDEALKTFLLSGADILKSGCEPKNHPYKMWKVINKYSMKPLIMSDMWNRKGSDVPRQKLYNVYWQNGAVDVFRREAVFYKGAYDKLKICPYIMDSDSSIDLDSKSDFEYAEYLLAKKSK